MTSLLWYLGKYDVTVRQPIGGCGVPHGGGGRRAVDRLSQLVNNRALPHRVIHSSAGQLTSHI